MKTIYDMNETMKQIGRQRPWEWLESAGLAAIADISEARPHEFTSGAALDLLVCGFILGKRAERRRRHGEEGQRGRRSSK